MSLEFTLVRRAISLAVIDGPDTGDNPDVLQAQGSVLFEPVIKKGDSIQVQTRGGSETYALAPIECPINDGIISHRGQDGVKLPAGGEAANPSLIRWKATFSRMQAGGKSFTLAPVVFDAVPGGEIDLTMVAPVAGAPEGVVRGPRGTSLESIIVDGSELVFTAVDDAGSFEIARIPLDEMVRAEAEAAADGVRDALAVDVAASQSARDAAEGHANSAATSESNAATSETNAKQSETNAGDYAAVATTAATEAVDAMERATEIVGGDFATREYVDAVGQDVQRIAKTTEQLDATRDDQFSIKDSDGRVAFSVDPSGRVTIPILDTGATDSETHVFLAAGQSNMQGFARPVGGDLDPINPRILQFGASSQKVEPAPAILDNPGGQIGLSPARVFANEYLKTQPDHVSVLLVPYAWGGTGFNSGSGPGATWDDRQATGGVRDLYTESVSQTQAALTAAGENAELKGILWHQGESNQNDSFEDYAAQLDRLIDNYRSDLGNTNLPFLIGQMTQEGFDVSPQKLVIDAAHQDTLRRKRYIGFATSIPGSTNYNDTTHFSRRGVEHLGAEYVASYFRALDNAPGFGPQQPVNVRAEFINGTLTVMWGQQPRRVTGYRVEYRIDGGEWVSVSRQYPMNLSERVTGLSGAAAEVRVTCINLAQETTQLYPAIAPHIQW